ncbi:rRNA maturation RNase YbeY, partial [Candidatus Woesebacteria bacterium]|nr:rRNA maturation RNase YbeY [Candidatus Woesebacteria bacterium]
MNYVSVSIGSRYPVATSTITACVERVLAKHNVDNTRVDVSIVGKRKIKQLNETHLHHQGPTDVLSFPQHERNERNTFPQPDGTLTHLGDIVVSFPEAVTQAKKYGKRVDDQ